MSIETAVLMLWVLTIATGVGFLVAFSALARIEGKLDDLKEMLEENEEEE